MATIPSAKRGGSTPMLMFIVKIITEFLFSTEKLGTATDTLDLAAKVDGLLVVRDREAVNKLALLNKNNTSIITYEELFLFKTISSNNNKPVIFDQGVFLEVLTRLMDEFEILEQQNSNLEDQVISFKKELINCLKSQNTEVLTLVHPDPIIRDLYKEMTETSK